MIFRKSFNPSLTGPIFISYRQSDGINLATNIAWALRSAGIAVWHDKTDLPPGDTARSLKSALSSGLSGAVLIVTPDIGESRIVRRIELPRILKLAHRARFVFAIGTTIRKPDATVDYSAADRLLGPRWTRLADRVQHPIDTEEGRWKLVEDLLQQRVQAIRAEKGEGQSFMIHAQTRVTAKSWDNDGSDLTVRFAAPTDSTLPSTQCLELLAKTLPMIARAAPLARPSTVQIKGGMHLSVALAFGMAFPSTIVPSVEVLDVVGERWQTPFANSGSSDQSLLTSTPVAATGKSTDRRVLVFVDLIAEPSPGAFERLVARGGWLAARHIRIRDAGDRIEPAQGAAIARELSSIIRTLSGEHDNAEVHLLLRAPMAIAVLLGTRMNTVPITSYEWTAGDGGSEGPTYHPVLRLASGKVDGPIVDVLPTS